MTGTFDNRPKELGRANTGPQKQVRREDLQGVPNSRAGGQRGQLAQQETNLSQQSAQQEAGEALRRQRLAEEWDANMESLTGLRRLRSVRLLRE